MSEPPAPRRVLPKILLAATVATAVGLCVLAYRWAGPDPETEECSWVFVRYEPSPWEVEWSQGVISGQRRDRECEVLATPLEVDRSVRLVRATQDAVLSKRPIPPDSVDLFSRMMYAKRCGADRRDTGQKRAQLIEPLVGIIRDPLTICPRPDGVPDDVYDSFDSGESPVQSKRHFLIGNAAPWSDTPDKPMSWRVGGFEPWALDTSATHCRRARQNILVDMGASTYSSWSGRPSAVGASWFVDRFKRHDLAFDWIVSYEYQKYDPDEIYRTVPPDVLPHYIYYSQPVEKDPDGKWNPWRMLRGMGTTPNDYVVVKLDIDSPDIENPLVEQIMKDPSLQTLIDEMFYEHHVNTKAMWRFWRTEESQILLADTYKNFAFLRSKGVRMHSWP
jgi:hypothetical protein